jgi:hypothetical protein
VAAREQRAASITSFWPTTAFATSARIATATFAACWNCSELGPG